MLLIDDGNIDLRVVDLDDLERPPRDKLAGCRGHGFQRIAVAPPYRA
ncbi:hypothetical protein [Mesorhizobium sp. LSJC264A00]|nr:hypothetical protein [Mesorhizobium sp. LSJC264A00]